MTKKILGVLSIISLGLVALTSCGGASEDLSFNRKATPGAEAVARYNLDFNNETGKLAYEKDDYSLYFANDIKSSLVTYEVDVLKLNNVEGNNLIESEDEKVRYIHSITYVFSDGTSALYSSETSQFVAMLYDTTEGAGKELTVDTLGFTPDLSASWTKTSDLKTPYVFYKNNNLSELKLEIVYLPTYFVRKSEGNVVMEQYILAPIYMAYTTNNGSKEIVNNELVDSKISSIKKSEFIFKEDSNVVLAQ